MVSLYKTALLLISPFVVFCVVLLYSQVDEGNSFAFFYTILLLVFLIKLIANKKTAR